MVVSVNGGPVNSDVEGVSGPSPFAKRKSDSVSSNTESKLSYSNLLQVIQEKAARYEAVLLDLRQLVEEGDIETLHRKRDVLVKQLLVDIGIDYSIIIRSQMQAKGSSYFEKICTDFSWYLNNVSGILRSFIMVEAS